MAAVIELSDIAKSFGAHHAVSGLSMRVEEGEVFGFLGPNGAGKTTTLRILLDIIAPDTGSRRLFGGATAKEAAKRIGYLPEERGLYKNMTAEHVIAYLARLKGMDKATATKRARDLLDRYGLGGAAKKRVKQLSKGMAQKVQVLSTLAHDPDLLILDEPFSGLDPVNQQVLEGLLADQKSAGKTVIFSTHVMQHAERLCDRILLIAGGRDIFAGTIAEARATLPPRIRLRSPGDVAPLRDLPFVRDITSCGSTDGITEWEIDADRSLSVERLIATCSEHAIPIAYFAMIEPSLHDVFVHFVGPEAVRHNLAGGEG